MKVIQRESWKARNPRAGIAGGNRPVEAFLHHSDDADGRHWYTLSDQCAKMRAIQNFHMDGRGWSDIAYHYLVFQQHVEGKDGRVFAGRADFNIPAAQENHNTNTLAICIVGNGEVETIDRHTRYLIEQILKRYPAVKTLGGHRDASSTACPGEKFYADIGKIAKAAGIERYR